jgi:hypothetical protein
MERAASVGVWRPPPPTFILRDDTAAVVVGHRQLVICRHTKTLQFRTKRNTVALFKTD